MFGTAVHWHSTLSILPGGNVRVFDEHEGPFPLQFSNDFVHAALNFDREIRKGNWDPKRPRPGGYREFAHAVNDDPHGIYHLCEFDDDNYPIVKGVPPPADFLPRIMRAPPPPPDAEARQRAAVAEQALYDYAFHQQRQAKRRLEFKEERQRQAREKHQQLMRGQYVANDNRDNEREERRDARDEQPAKKQKTQSKAKETRKEPTEKGSRGPGETTTTSRKDTASKKASSSKSKEKTAAKDKEASKGKEKETSKSTDMEVDKEKDSDYGLLPYDGEDTIPSPSDDVPMASSSN